jgi:hypothetical protein
MKYRRIITACGLAFSLALCAFSLGGCVLLDALFPEDPPPQLIIRNESFGDITSIEFWESTPEIAEKGAALITATLLVMLSSDLEQFLANIVVLGIVYSEYEEATSALVKTPPQVKDTAVIPYDGSRSYELNMDKSYAARVNGDIWSHVSLNSTRDTVYVFDGEYLTSKE